MEIIDELKSLSDPDYQIFQSRLLPTLDPKQIIGVRVPKLRQLAKSLIKRGEHTEFINSLPHNYYDENMLQALIINEVDDFEQAVKFVDEFLPFVDNWAVCDSLNPKVFKKHRTPLLHKIDEWMSSKHTFTCRFGIKMLMTYFMDEYFLPKYLEQVGQIQSEDYYVNMMIAWYFATALTKQWDQTISYFENPKLGRWTHNKAIQKARESRQIAPEKKEYLKKLKI